MTLSARRRCPGLPTRACAMVLRPGQDLCTICAELEPGLGLAPLWDLEPAP